MRHLFVLWEKSQNKEAVLRDLERRFEVVQVRYVVWQRFSETLARFYMKDVVGLGKVARCGSGPFIAVVVDDPEPMMDLRRTTSGIRMVNTRVFDAKQEYRRWAGDPDTVHATDDDFETRHNLAMLDEPGVPDWPHVGELFRVLDAYTPYVVLRNYEPLPGEYNVAGHGDIDFLVGDLDAAVYALGAVKVFPEPYRVHYQVQIAGEQVPIDLRFLGDGYFDPLWQQDVLDRRVRGFGFWHPNDEDYYWTLLYHAYAHKGGLRPDYREVLERLRPGDAHSADDLVRYMGANGYWVTVPDDHTVPPRQSGHTRLSGLVADGHGAASRDIQMGVYGDLGYEPFPGTLNVQVTPETAALLTGPSQQVRFFEIDRYLWPARIGGVRGHLLYAPSAWDGTPTVELIAPVRLREQLGLANGNTVEIEISRDLSEAGPLPVSAPKQLIASVVLALGGGVAEAERCITAIVTHTPEGAYDAVVVDDATTDGTEIFLQCLEGDVQVIRNQAAQGLPASRNIGAQQAKGDVLVFVGADVEVSAGWLEPLLAELVRDPQLGAVGPRVVLPVGDLHSGITVPAEDGPFRAVTSALAVRSEAFKEVGGFDGEGPMLSAEIEFCRKLTAAGWTVRCIPASAVVSHSSPQTWVDSLQLLEAGVA